MKNRKLPSFYGILEVQHYVEGRIRIKIDSLKNDNEKAEELKVNLLKLNGINEVTINTLLGTILVKFDEIVIEPVILIGVLLNFLGLEEEAFEKKNGKMSFVLKDVIEAVDMTLYNKTKGILDLKTSIALFFTVYGVKKLRQNPIMPNGVNLLWWAYNIMTRGGK
ncbi:HMA2 domain-containing protein [uncultured Fusobacterium sp.]|uniref:HMA2 domain-containing protein n=1 Tax=uncultured Fusobacterium sp. TaxID=159267 RepID=UPI0025D9B591|nr:hypothetical protein [uncultured Fusobacterium sp.]